MPSPSLACPELEGTREAETHENHMSHVRPLANHMLIFIISFYSQETSEEMPLAA